MTATRFSSTLFCRSGSLKRRFARSVLKFPFSEIEESRSIGATPKNCAFSISSVSSGESSVPSSVKPYPNTVRVLRKGSVRRSRVREMNGYAYPLILACLSLMSAYEITTRSPTLSSLFAR